ncbi:LysR substrate-binding domain-containing protein [Halomonas caseinilytica]|uniref:LysR substrate-binding domain-containing protein n=1 Tax=Halomonas caseinilytica TaxID=438744 RepID=UPI0008493E49|nr:LysR substrate-binding domain-containing protein [Halomonas caseinilytica]
MSTPLPIHKLPPLSSLRGFEAAARLQSLRAAAEELHLTHPAVANQVQRLEESLGVKLFKRAGRHIELTAAGERFYPHVRDAIITLIHGAEGVRQLQKSSPLRVQVYVTTSIRWLAPRLAKFHEDHPDVELQLMTYSVDWAFDEANADIAIIFRDTPVPEHLHWSPLFSSELFPVCSPSMLEGGTVSPEDLKQFPLVGVYTESWSWDSWLRLQSSSSTSLEEAPPRDHIIVDTLAAALEMAVRGEGVALVNGPFADDDIAAGRLTNPVNEVVETSGEWGVICHRDVAEDPRVMAFIDWLVSQVD